MDSPVESDVDNPDEKLSLKARKNFADPEEFPLKVRKKTKKLNIFPKRIFSKMLLWTRSMQF